MRDDHLFRELRALHLDPDDFVIFGSAPLFAHGLRTSVRDLDVVARGAVLARVSADGTPSTGACGGDRVWTFCAGRLEFFERWITRDWDTDELIGNAEIVEGLRFAPLTEVLRYKEKLMRPKDVDDIRMLREHLGLPSTADRATALTGSPRRLPAT